VADARRGGAILLACDGRPRLTPFVLWLAAGRKLDAASDLEAGVAALLAFVRDLDGRLRSAKAGSLADAVDGRRRLAHVLATADASALARVRVQVAELERTLRDGARVLERLRGVKAALERRGSPAVLGR
jgi:hypothetical protein